MTKEVFDRLVQEFQDLSVKVTKCREFILNEDKFNELDTINKDLLIAQLKAMETYISILSIRLGLNAPKEEESTNEEVVLNNVDSEERGD